MFLKVRARYLRIGPRPVLWTLCFVSATGGVSHAALAQDVSSGPPDAAGSRAQPAYDAPGIPVGTFRLYPTLSVNTAYDSNIYARSADQQADGMITVTPALAFRRDTASQQLALTANARLRRYFTVGSQNDEQYKLGAQGAFQIGDSTQVAATAGWDRSTVARGTYANQLQLGQPLQMDGLTGDLSLQHSFNRVSVQARASADRFDYDDVRLTDGTVVDQSYRNGYRIGATLGTSYRMGARVSAQIKGSVNKYDYTDSNPQTSRDATGYSVTAGGRYEISRLLILDLGAGVRWHKFNNPLYKDYSGLALNGRLRWYPTPLLSVRFDLEQSTSTSSSVQVSAVQVTSAKLEADYELKRNLVWTAGSEISREDYGGISGKSTFVEFDTRLNWKLNRWLRLTPSASYLTRQGSTSASSTYDAVRVALALTLAR